MNMTVRFIFTVILFVPGFLMANQAHIEDAKLIRQGESWAAHVTLRHADTGWDHYADGWRVLDAQGKVLAHRTLFHPHETEQPFTRSLSGIKIPSNLKEVYIEAHDKVHGWNPEKFTVRLK